MIIIYTDYDEELLFKFTLSSEDGLSEVTWSDAADFPPLPPREAIKASKLELGRMLSEFGADKDAKFSECSLACSNGHWYYVITWFVSPQEPGDRRSLRVPIYLSGNAPKYQVYKYKDRFEAYET